MKNNEKLWKILEIVFGAIGAAVIKKAMIRARIRAIVFFMIISPFAVLKQYPL